VYLWGWTVHKIVMKSWPNATPEFNALTLIFAALMIGIASWHIVENLQYLKKQMVKNG
jgi:peptidoglycan/LPS O-acetylase OafA/YrhL